MTAGILPSRRVRRAAPLPNSVRSSAGIFSVLMGKLLARLCRVRGPGDRSAALPWPDDRQGARRSEDVPAQSITESQKRELPRRGNLKRLLAEPSLEEIVAERHAKGSVISRSAS